MFSREQILGYVQWHEIKDSEKLCQLKKSKSRAIVLIVMESATSFAFLPTDVLPPAGPLGI